MKPNSNGTIYLDAYRLDDAAVFVEVDRDPEHRRRFEFPEDFVPSLEHSQNVIRSWMEAAKSGTLYGFAVRDLKTDQLVGGCEIRPQDKGTANLSYWTRHEFRGRGIASGAVRIACGIASQLGITRLEILVDEDNHASMRVALKNGFALSGERDGRVCYHRNPQTEFETVDESP